MIFEKIKALPSNIDEISSEKFNNFTKPREQLQSHETQAWKDKKAE